MTAVLPLNRWMGDGEFLRDSTTPKPSHYVSPDGTTFIPAGRDFTTGAVHVGHQDGGRAASLPPGPRRRGTAVLRHERSGAEDVAIHRRRDGTLTEPKLFANEGGECVTADDQGNVYIAAGQILVFDPSGKQIDTIEVPQRPTCLVFGGPDRKTLFITARSSLYSVRFGV